MFYFLIGLFLGATIGLGVAAILAMSKYSDMLDGMERRVTEAEKRMLLKCDTLKQ